MSNPILRSKYQSFLHIYLTITLTLYSISQFKFHFLLISQNFKEVYEFHQFKISMLSQVSLHQIISIFSYFDQVKTNTHLITKYFILFISQTKHV